MKTHKIDLFLILIVCTLTTGCATPKTTRTPTREEFMQSLARELDTIRNEGNFVRIGTNGWFYFVSIKAHKGEAERGERIPHFNMFVVRDYPEYKGWLGGLSIGMDDTGRLYYSDAHICAVCLNFPVALVSYDSMDDFLRMNDTWKSLTNQTISASNNASQPTK